MWCPPWEQAQSSGQRAVQGWKESIVRKAGTQQTGFNPWYPVWSSKHCQE